MTALSFCWCALRSSGGIVTSSYRSARELSGYRARASRIACAVCSILAFCASVGVGHGVLHEQFFLRNDGHCSLYEEEAAGIRCRSDYYDLREKSSVVWTDIRRVEWQANRLSAAILMPKSMVAVMVARNPLNRNVMSGYGLAYAMGETFNVSTEAAYYRLVDLGYVDKEYPVRNQQASIFGFTCCSSNTG